MPDILVDPTSGEKNTNTQDEDEFLTSDIFADEIENTTPTLAVDEDELLIKNSEATFDWLKNAAHENVAQDKQNRNDSQNRLETPNTEVKKHVEEQWAASDIPDDFSFDSLSDSSEKKHDYDDSLKGDNYYSDDESDETSPDMDTASIWISTSAATPIFIDKTKGTNTHSPRQRYIYETPEDTPRRSLPTHHMHAIVLALLFITTTIIVATSEDTTSAQAAKMKSAYTKVVTKSKATREEVFAKVDERIKQYQESKKND